jgi:hypothetical protein
MCRKPVTCSRAESVPPMGYIVALAGSFESAQHLSRREDAGAPPLERFQRLDVGEIVEPLASCPAVLCADVGFQALAALVRVDVALVEMQRQPPIASQQFTNANHRRNTTRHNAVTHEAVYCSPKQAQRRRRRVATRPRRPGPTEPYVNQDVSGDSEVSH